MNAIKLDDRFSNFQVVGAKANKQILEPLSKVNLFVGENNSGKSRLLRRLAMDKLIFTATDFKGLNDLLQQLNQGIDLILEKGRTDANLLFKDVKVSSSPIGFITEGTKYLEIPRKYIDRLRQTEYQANDVIGNWNSQKVANLKHFGEEMHKRVQNLNLRESYKFRKVYVPTLRGLRDISSVGDYSDVYQTRVTKDYFKDGKEIPEIVTGLSFYNEYRRMLLGDTTKRNWARKFENFISSAFFQNRPFTIIPSEESRAVEVKIGNHKQRLISDLGEGIHSLIILTFPLFKYANDELLVFFEEPELFLHPGYQRLFLDTLTSNRFPKHQYFISTHSNHFLDLTADTKSISVFTFKSQIPQGDEPQGDDHEHDPEILIENVSNDNTHTLELLGVRNSSVFLSNCTIWVEGITDRRYLSHFLKLHADFLKTYPFKEDLHFSFVEYSGSNITHWSFLDNHEDSPIVERLCGKLFLIADADGAPEGTKKHERLIKLKEHLKERFHLLTCREIENILTPNVITAVIKNREDSQLEIKAFEQEDYATKKLGDFIDQVLLEGKLGHKRYSNNGTIYNKVDFCDEAKKCMGSFEDLSDHAKELTKKLFNFIKANNSHLFPEQKENAERG